MMPRVFLTTPQNVGDQIVLSGPDGHHFSRVLRVRAGEPLAVVAAGKPYLADVSANDAESGTVSVTLTQPLPSHESPIHVYLVQGLAKGDKIDAVLQHNTEVGVAGFLLFESARSVMRLDPRKTDDKLLRWRRIVREAAAQAQRDRIPDVDYAPNWRALENWLQTQNGLPLLLDEAEQARGLAAILRETSHRDAAPMPNFAIAVGPEGGWTDEERGAWAALGGQAVSLGPRILRTETAGLVAASAIFHEFGQLGG